MTAPFDSEANPSDNEPQPRTKPGPRKGRKLLLGILAFLVLAAVVAGGFLFNLARTFDSNSTKIETAFPAESNRPQKSAPVDGKAAMNILILGSDSRGASETEAANGVASDQRADTLMLMHIPADRQKIYTISVMRDLWVDIPGHGNAKINAALALGGVPLMVQTMESIFKQRIDHVAMVDFEGFKGLTDALGGVEIDVKIPFEPTHLKGHYFDAGKQIMSGEEALAFVRERYAFADGDYQRVRDQQEFLKAILRKTMDANTLANPLTVNSLVSSVSPFIGVDKGLDAASLAGLAVELRNIRQDGVTMFTLPTKGIGTSADGQSIVLTDPAAIESIAAALKQDRMDSYVRANNLQKGN